MEAAFELPIQSPTGERIVIDRTAPAYPPLRPPSPPEAPSLSQLRTAHSRSSLSPKRLPSSSAARTRLAIGKTPQVSRDGETGRVTYSGGSLRELKLRRMTQPRESDRSGARLTLGRPKKRTSPTSIPKSLLPATERKSQEENKLDRLSKKDAQDSGDKWEIAPDGTSAGREGRQFTVANVGNNGRIYLRPTVRPAHLRSPQPNFVFPMTPPGTAGLDILMQDKDKRSDQQHRPQQQQSQQQQHPQPQPNQQEQRHEIQRQPPLRLEAATTFYGSDWTPDQPSSPTALPVSRPRLFNANNTSRNVIQRPSTAGAVGGRPGGGHRRAISDSTIQDTSIARESEPGGFKIVITQPVDDKQRAKTLEDLTPKHPNGSAPHLEIAIPTWKIGSPRFTLRGTPMIRGSSYTPTEEPYSNRPSYFSPAFDHSHSVLEEDSSVSPRQGLFERQKTRGQGLSSPLSPRFRIDVQLEGPRPAYHSNYAVVVPDMFDSLTFKPACDDRTIVRFSPATNAITAATPPRLVAEITSPKFMDYDLVSDFFLTYRAFLDARDLLRMLVARLRWAMDRDDETGMVVRVRTFVALRHWILNYFMDDFVIDYELRVLFCDLLNGFVNELSQDPRGRKVQLKILTELKKCWRRSCAQYWDGPDFDDSLGPDVPITPGGIAGHRNATLDPTFWEQVAFGTVPNILPDESEEDEGSNFLTHLQSPETMVQPEPGSSFHATGGQASHIDSVILGDRPSTPENQESYNDFSARRQASPVSITSLDIVSCSFPTKNMKLLQASMGQPLGAHPVDPSLVYSNTGPIATTPRALVGKRVRPNDGQKASGQGQQQHKRNNSLTDSLREHASTMDKLLQRNNEILMSLPYAGSLVRGAIFPPGQPYVEVLPPGTSGGMSRQTTLFQPFLEVPDPQKLKASAMSSQGMRKLLGSVRRALSTRGQTISPTQGNFINMAPIGPRGATTNRLPGTAIVPQARPRMNGFRPPVRIDLLGAKIAEDFKVAVREDASQDAAAQPGDDVPADVTDAGEGPSQQPQPKAKAVPSGYSDSLFLGWTPEGVDNLVRPISDAGITTGSKSIVIVDGTMPLEFPAMTGALALPNSNNASVEMFGETFLSVAADPTPPTTPPGQPMGTPRRSSYILGQQVVRPSLSMDPLPPFVPDMETLGHSSTVGPSRPIVADTSIRPSSDVLSRETDDDIILPQRPVEEDVQEEAASEDQNDITINTTMATNSFGLPSSPPIRRPQPSWIQGHSRHRSSRSHRSQKSSRSYDRRRFVSSYASSTAPPTGVLSFDASSYNRASLDAASIDEAPQPHRILRRRPGGDLRAVTNVGDLDQGPIRRSRSVGSLTTYSESIRSSFVHNRARGSGGFVDVISVDFTTPREKGDTFSVGMMTGNNKKKVNKRMSIFSTHSSKPVMRPSFEAEAQKLAQIPDDVDDDGGVESALLKLEGKFERKSKKLSFSEPPFKVYSPAMAGKGPAAPPLSGFLAPQPSSQDNNRLTTEEKIDHRHRQIVHSDLAPSHQSMLSKLGQQSTAGGTELDAIESEFGTEMDAPRGSSMATSSHVPAFSPPPAFRPAAVPRMNEDIRSFLSESGESYSSIPLLDRGLTDDGKSKGVPTESEWANQSIFEEANESSTQIPTGHHGDLAHQTSYEMVEKTESIEKIPPGETMPQSPGQATDVSFLEDESDHASDLSSELSVEFPEENDENGIFGPSTASGPVRSNTVVSRLPAHPLGDPQIEPAQTPPMPFQEQHPGKLVEDIDIHDGHPPSPPITLVQALQMSPDTAKIPELHDFQVWEDKPLPPTPNADGTAPNTLRSQKQVDEAEVLSSVGLRSMFEQPISAQAKAKAEAARTFSVHLPFILAFESEILAQQFTLIEKDALHEIDWKELIEMRWKNAENGNARSWVDFLRNSDARGVEVVIARFNIMVKWAISEVILTQDLEERARCLIKFIHIAAHCRRYRNYATMSQIAIALTSNEVSRLSQTWALIPPSDARTLRDLEALVSPTRNFYNLRAEMEAVGIDNADAGCIPFVGIYTHDLLFNAQRPSEIASSPTTPPLVNFERCRFAASIVKTLLRLVEASALYNFQPIEGITERCLWMSALSDDDIRKYSDALE